jgi:hypothetical protein
MIVEDHIQANLYIFQEVDTHIITSIMSIKKQYSN